MQAGAAWAAMYSVEVDADARGVGGGGVLGGRRRAASARCGSSREVVVVAFSSSKISTVFSEAW